MFGRPRRKERTRERVPLDRAATRNNLGHAIQILRERVAGRHGSGEAAEFEARYYEQAAVTQRESVRASLRRNVRRLLAKYGYPQDLAEDATQLVLRQAELSTENSE